MYDEELDEMYRSDNVNWDRNYFLMTARELSDQPLIVFLNYPFPGIHESFNSC